MNIIRTLRPQRFRLIILISSFLLAALTLSALVTLGWNDLLCRLTSLSCSSPRSRELKELLAAFFVGATTNLLVLWLTYLLPNTVLDMLNRSILPVFWRAESQVFPHERFFRILDEEAESITKIDIFAHFHSHWLGISNKKEDTTGHHGEFYQRLFSQLKYRAAKAKGHPRKKGAVVLRILFLDYSLCSEDVVEHATEVLRVPGQSKAERIETARYRMTRARSLFEGQIKTYMRNLIDEGVLSDDSEIRWAHFIPTMGIVRLQYKDNNGENAWLQAEILTHADKSTEESRFTIMLQQVTTFGLFDDRMRKFEEIIEGEWNKAKQL